ncbi:MAG: response regulator [Acidobacteria bacterium]|nr:response regulator [Acidobacteriota bacterium]MBV8892112.1 response regulator [Acidobacteriota bacterium]
MTSPMPKAEQLPVLLIEDEPSVMAYVQAALERGGYKVVACESAVQGLDMLASGNYLGVVSDMRTPGGINGADVHAWIVEHRPELASRIIFITGDIANEETVETLRKTGAPCVEKPFRVQQFIEVVESTLARSE